MHKVLSPKRLEIIRAMAGAGPLSIREIARRVGRDFKGVHSDVSVLLKTGVVDKSESGKLIFPHDRIHVDFEISAAA
jgi:predicted transcriptional regulator